MSSSTPAPSTPEARRTRRLRTALSGLALAGGALLATATPALAAPEDAADAAQPSDAGVASYENAEGGGPASNDPAAIDGELPTPASEGAPYGDEYGGPTVLGVPLKGTLNSVERATSILPGSGPGDYA